MRLVIFSLFPHWFEGPLGESVLQRARERGVLKVDLVNPRDWSADRHQTVDDAPYGGGGGMVLMPEPLAAAMDQTIGPPGTAGRPHVVYLSPRGKVFTQQRANELAQLPAIALLCGHYEAVDQRLLDTRVDEEISLGDFVLTGGEIPAMAVVDAVARQIPGVLGNELSAQTESFMTGLLEGPHYTRPEEWEDRGVPKVLLSGNHAAIAEWREERALEDTRARRPDLFVEQLLYPGQIRRLARRGRPFIVYRHGPGESILPYFVSRAIVELPGWQDVVKRTRSEAGVLPWIRVAEVREARGESSERDRELLLQDAAGALSAVPVSVPPPMPQSSARFLQNLLLALHTNPPAAGP